ncbi:cytochrome b561 [Albidovulum inexpectatum]|uniref:Cytochrome b561 n=1 Tax=Albidovulum inexpectatum TaxID=196587 RepID=A0A2S5JLE2_9RHOB|nr:cytochrome b/b6 domain-containing protein [Albidovulum inexpectatum]PPB82221.1 cytochrome b561 [Albidovulum inexpectatum]
MRSAEGYSRAQIVLHWAIAALMLLSFVSHEGMKDAWRAFLRATGESMGLGAWLHVISGIAILALAAWRLGLRATRGAPSAPKGSSALMERAAAAVHWGLYAVMLGLPVTGALAWFGGIRDLGEIHEVLFNLGLALVAIHVAAALWHQFVLRDGLLKRMVRPTAARD